MMLSDDLTEVPDCTAAFTERAVWRWVLLFAAWAWLNHIRQHYDCLFNLKVEVRPCCCCSFCASPGSVILRQYIKMTHTVSLTRLKSLTYTASLCKYIKGDDYSLFYTTYTSSLPFTDTLKHI